jgi:large subunit ribosomal protein L31
MKANIHPKYKHDIEIKCACGNVFISGSTKDEISVDICSACHPFYTGEMKFVDTQGRVEKFQSKMQQAGKFVSKKTKRQEKDTETETRAVTLKEMIQTQQKQTKAPKKA